MSSTGMKDKSSNPRRTANTASSMDGIMPLSNYAGSGGHLVLVASHDARHAIFFLRAEIPCDYKLFQGKSTCSEVHPKQVALPSSRRPTQCTTVTHSPCLRPGNTIITSSRVACYIFFLKTSTVVFVETVTIPAVQRCDVMLVPF